jgi:hypothetical protein
MSVSAKLSVDARKRLKACEALIEQRAFYEVGSTLLEIRRDKLYLETHKTFESYCRERWKFSRIHAHRLVESARVTDNLLPIGNIPTHESQVRPLTKLAPEQQREAWKRALEISPDPTAAQIQIAVASLEGEKFQPAKDGRVTISLGTIECPMSSKDVIYSLGHDYERAVCKLIETRAETEDKIRSLVAYLSTDLDLRKVSIRNYFTNNNKKTASGVHPEAA